MKKRSFRVALLCIMCFILSLGIAAPAMAASKKPAKPKIKSVALTAPKTITVKWNKAKNAKQYELYVSVDGDDFRKLKKTKARSFVHRNIKPGCKYTYRLRAINGKKKSKYSSTKSITVKKTKLDYYDDLKEYIEGSGETTQGGEPLLVLEDGSNEYSIIYSPSKKTFSFFMSYEFSDGTESYIEIYVTPNALKTGKAKVDYDYYGSFNINISTTINMATYNNQDLSWSGRYYSEDDLANAALRLAFAGWRVLLKNQTDLTLNQLGFTVFGK